MSGSACASNELVLLLYLLYRYGHHADRVANIVTPLYNGCVRLFDIIELPFTLVRRATIPLIEQDSYSRPWFLASAFFAPLAVVVYLGQPAWMLLPAAAAGAACAAAAYLGTQDSKVR